MTLYLASDFLSHLDLLRTVAIAGGKGTGKDLLAFELSRYYLDRGYRFTSNQQTVWSDPLYKKVYMTDEEWRRKISAFGIDSKGPYRLVRRDNSFIRLVTGEEVTEDVTEKVYLRYDEMLEFAQSHGKDDNGYFYWQPDVTRRVLILSEGGRYLRAWKYFENMYEFTRKTDNYILIPSIRLPHVDLCEMVVVNILPFRQYIGTNGGVWYWTISGQGLAKPKNGWFIHIPKEYGLYDTKDLSDSPTATITAFTRQIQHIQETQYKRDRLSVLEGFSESGELDGLATIARSLERSALSAQNKNKR
jgi:hypothetical protein